MPATYATQGDVVTFLDSGLAKLGYGKGTTAQEIAVQAGEVMAVDRPTSIANVDVHVASPRVPRTINKRRFRPQHTRHCDLSFAKLELPAVGDPKLRELEAKLKERGDTLKARLRTESTRLAQ